MKTEKANKQLEKLISKINKEFNVEEIIKELKEIREVALAEEDPLLVRVFRQMYEYLEENQGLEDERLELIEERTSLQVKLQQKALDARSRRGMVEEMGRALNLKDESIRETQLEMSQNNIEPAEEGVSLPSVGDAERNERTLQRRLDSHGPVNMLAIEQFDACEARLAEMKGDFKVLQHRRHLIDVTGKLEEQRKERLVKVLEKVNENFKVAYKSLSDGGRGEYSSKTRMNRSKVGSNCGLSLVGSQPRSRDISCPAESNPWQHWRLFLPFKITTQVRSITSTRWIRTSMDTTQSVLR